MAKQGKTPLSLKATQSAKYLQEHGHKVPTSLLMEMFARQDGYGCYAAYKAAQDAAGQTASLLVASEEPTQRLVLIYCSDRGDWSVIPQSLTDYYEAKACGDFLEIIRENWDLINAVEAGDILVSFKSVEKAIASSYLTQVYCIGPNFDRYGMPPVEWLKNEENFQLSPEDVRKRLSLQEDLTDFHDLGDDSGGFTFLEVLVTSEVAYQLNELQGHMYVSLAAELAEDIRSKATCHEFKPNFEEVLQAEYSERYLDTPEFHQAFRNTIN